MPSSQLSSSCRVRPCYHRPLSRPSASCSRSMTASGSDGRSEETPLLTAKQHEEIYLRFKPAKKRGIVAIVSATGLLACKYSLATLSYHNVRSDPLFSLVFVSGTFVPSIPQVAKDLNSTPAIVGYVSLGCTLFRPANGAFSLAVSFSILAASLGSLIGATYSGFCECSVLSVTVHLLVAFCLSVV